MIRPGDKVGSRLQFFIPTEKGNRWGHALGLKIARYKSGVGHEFMVQGVKKALERCLPDIAFFPPGEGLGICGVQPDLLAGMGEHGRDGSEGSWRMAIQVSCTSKPAYEAKKAIELSRILQIDLVIVVARNKSGRRELEKRIGRELKASGEGDSRDMQGDDGVLPLLRCDPGTENGGQGTETGGDSGGAGESKKGQNQPHTEKKKQTHNQKRMGRIEVLDFETCASAGYDWTWVLD